MDNKRWKEGQDVQDAFQDAIRRGTLVDTPPHRLWAGNWMYMGTQRFKSGWYDMFKNIDTRQYMRSGPVTT